MNNYVGHQRDKYEVKTSQCRPPILSGYRVLVRNSGFGRPCAGQTHLRHPVEKFFFPKTWLGHSTNNLLRRIFL